MTKLLYIEASPRKATSYSSQVAEAFLAAYAAQNPDHEIERLPLFEVDLPSFGEEGANQKMENLYDQMGGGDGVGSQGEWKGVLAEIERLQSADKVLLSAPMWNYSIPYRLKHWIDLVVQVGESIKVNEKFEYVGQVTGKPLQMVLASGSEYEMRFPLESDGLKIDFQRAYLDHIFRFLGFEDIRLVKVQPMGIPGPGLETALQEAKDAAMVAARTF